MRRNLSQPRRLLVIGLYVLALLATSKAATDSWLPPATTKGLWFYSGLAAIVLGDLLFTPFFLRPVDVVAYSVAALVALLSAFSTTEPSAPVGEAVAFALIVAYLALLLATSATAIALRASSEGGQRVAALCYRFASTFGTARLTFSAVFLFLLIAIHRHSAREYLILGIAWMIVVVARPLETIGAFVSEAIAIFRPRAAAKETIGEIVAHETPGTVLIREDPDSKCAYGDLLEARDEDGRIRFTVALDRIGYSEGRWLRALHVPAAAGVMPIAADNLVRRVDEAALPAEALAAIQVIRKDLLGLVAPGTNLSTLLVDIVRTDVDLAEGQLVQATIANLAVLYQIVEGVTKEELLQEKNTRGYFQAQARKIGVWSDERRRFETVPWVPMPNGPVLLGNVTEGEFTGRSIGHFPGTGYTVSVSFQDLVTHNAAILGVLGAGKSFLGLELAERMIAEGIRIMCLDLSNQYARELGLHYNEEWNEEARQGLVEVGRAGKQNVSRNVEEGGSVRAFQEAVERVANDFLDPAKAHKFSVFDPSGFEVWRQDSRPFQDQASMASLTPTEITRIFAEAMLGELQAQGMTETARCCLVLEEAHSLVPEWNAVAAEGDRTATNGTARAILQGRKFGFGCLLVTQRTASVTKTILNQCNTVFAFRTFDATGMDFLCNYIGDDYAGVLQTLEDRHAVVFGRASSCTNPVLVRLNDRDKFVEAFRGG